MEDDAAARLEAERDAALHVLQEPNLGALTLAAVRGDACDQLLSHQTSATSTHCVVPYVPLNTQHTPMC